MLGTEMGRGTKSLGEVSKPRGAVPPRAGKVFSEMSFRILPRRCFEGPASRACRAVAGHRVGRARRGPPQCPKVMMRRPTVEALVHLRA